MSKEISLLEHCQEQAITHIRCSTKGCYTTSTEDTEALEAIDEFYKNGWRVRKGECYCPSCSKDYGLLKSLNLIKK